MSPTRTSLLCALPALIAVCAAAAPAGAQPVDPHKLAAAQALLDEAQAEMDKKDYAAACPKLEEVTRLLPNGVGGRLALARCYDGAGRLASAWTAYVVAQAAADEAHRSSYEAEAHARAEALEPRLARMTVEVPDAVRALPGLAIECDGVPVGPAQWGTPVPVDKGRHVVAATATGKARWEQVVEVGADGARVSVQVTGLADAKVESPAEQTASPGPWIVGGIGVAALIAGAVTGGIVVAEKGVANAHCTAGPPPTCMDQTGLDAASKVRTLGPVTTVALTVGAAGVAAGAIWLGVRRSGSVSVRVGVAPALAGATWRVDGSW